MSDEPTKPARTGMSLPGQPTEEALADVGSNAGKSLIRGLGRLGGTWIAEREARAEAAKLAIKNEAEIAAAKAVVNARREDEIAELEHQEQLELRKRRIQRMAIELDREQANLEAIETKALEFTESHPDNTRGKEIEEDWLFKFAESAQKISNEDVQKLWARVLSSAAIQEAPLLTAQGLQTLSFFDSRVAGDFEKFVFVISILGFFPALNPEKQKDPQSIDLDQLLDLDLIQHHAGSESYSFQGFKMEIGTASVLNLLKDRFYLTKRGSDIANAVFHGSEFNPGDDVIDAYIQLLVEKEIGAYKSVSIYLPSGAGVSSKAFEIDSDAAGRNDLWATSEKSASAPQMLSNLLTWAASRYRIRAF